jgi:hypothetical protein
MKMKIAVQNEMVCGSAFFSLLKKFIHKLENLCADGGVLSIANIQLGDGKAEEGGPVKEARFDVQMSDGRLINIATTARTVDDAISNAFDQCTKHITTILGSTV